MAKMAPRTDWGSVGQAWIDGRGRGRFALHTEMHRVLQRLPQEMRFFQCFVRFVRPPLGLRVLASLLCIEPLIRDVELSTLLNNNGARLPSERAQGPCG